MRPGRSAADTETTVCCLCAASGEPLYRLPPFGVVRCPACGLVFVSPRLTPAALQRLYDEPTYFDGGVYGDRSRWSPAMVLQRTWTRGRITRLVQQNPPPARLLEIGSGYGLFLAAARDAGYRVSGVELSRTGVRVSGELGLDVFGGQLAQSPQDPADVVCFWDTLEHVPDPLAFLGAGAVPARAWRSFRAVRAQLLVDPHPAARCPVVDAQARAAHLALHPGDPLVGRRPSRPGDHRGDPIAAAARPTSVGWIRWWHSAGPFRTKRMEATMADVPGRCWTVDRTPPSSTTSIGQRHAIDVLSLAVAASHGDRRGARCRDDPCVAVHRAARVRSIGRRPGVRGRAAVRRAAAAGSARTAVPSLAAHPRRCPRGHSRGADHLGQGDARRSSSWPPAGRPPGGTRSC